MAEIKKLARPKKKLARAKKLEKKVTLSIKGENQEGSHKDWIS